MTQELTQVSIAGLEAQVLPQKALFLPAFSTAVVADLHFGKASHFRKHGIGVPDLAEADNLACLHEVLTQTGASRLVLAGDAFHSRATATLEEFKRWREAHDGVEIILVRGNHDILPKPLYERLGIQIEPEELQLGETLTIRHHPLADNENHPRYVLAGHVHPGYNLYGVADKLSLPCLWLGKRQGLLPAFGKFTGLAMVRPERGDGMFVFAEKRVFRVPV